MARAKYLCPYPLYAATEAIELALLPGSNDSQSAFWRLYSFGERAAQVANEEGHHLAFRLGDRLLQLQSLCCIPCRWLLVVLGIPCACRETALCKRAFGCRSLHSALGKPTTAAALYTAFQALDMV